MRRFHSVADTLLLGTLAAGSTLSLLAPSRSWALERKTLSTTASAPSPE